MTNSDSASSSRGTSRIVSRIEALAKKVAEASRLQKEITAEMDALCRALITNPPDGVLTPTVMSELLEIREPDVRCKQPVLTILLECIALVEVSLQDIGRTALNLPIDL